MPMKSNLSVIRRFTGFHGRTQLLDAFRRQLVVAGDLQLARKLANHASLHSHGANHNLITQGCADNDIYFILSGSVSIIVIGDVGAESSLMLVLLRFLFVCLAQSQAS